MKICFWGNIGKALIGTTSGGGELQIALLAKALAKGGHEVVVIDYKTPVQFKTDDNIIVHPIKGWNKGIRLLRTLTHRLPQLYFTLRDQKADVYYCRIRDPRHIIALWAAHRVKAKFILGMAEDLDVMNFKMRFNHYYFKNVRSLWGIFSAILCEIIYPLLLRKSDVNFVQHEGQQQMLLQKGIKSILFPNLIDLTQIHIVSNPTHNYFIYVGWLDKQKGIAEFFEVVKKAPLHTFIVIGPPRDKSGHIFYEKLKSFQNVSLLGELKHSETLRYIAYSKALISTSHMEGFPNIFIEAWAYGIPVLSLYVDPGSTIEKEKLGEISHGNLNKLLLAMDNNINTEEFAKRAKSYVERNHALNASKIEEISSLFSKIVNQEKL
jgi:glycosyltransferase involved in cell wall biosynthesis